MMREPGDSPPQEAASSDDENNSNNNSSNNNDGCTPSVLRSLLIASFLLSLLTLIDMYYTTFLLNTNTNNNDNNNNKSSWAPFKQMAEIFIPQLLIRYSPSKYNGNHVYMDEMDVAIDGKICPPDGFLDDGLSQLHHYHDDHHQLIRNEEKSNGIHFSSEYDPRNKVLRPSLFPHCELKKWVELQQYHNHQNNQKEQQEKQHECANGEEYITHIYPNNLQHQHQQQSSSSSNTNNVKILHIAANNNCLPKRTIQSLQSLTNHYYTTSTTNASNNANNNNSQSKTIIAIYIHSSKSIDTILHQHIWTTFPEVTEGLLCGIHKVQFVLDKVLDVLLVKPAAAAADNNVETAATNDDAATTNQEEELKKKKKEVIANEISYLIKRDIWRYLLLWEFGGTVIDLDVLQSIIDRDDDDTNGNLMKVAQDWFFGSDSGDDDDGDAFVTMMNGEVGRMAVTSVMGASRPHHPLLYFAAKKALRSMISDNYLAWGDAPEFVSVLHALCLFCLLMLLFVIENE
jgi:hypothetical protein